VRLLEAHGTTGKDELDQQAIDCRIAGRIVALRRFGKAAFASLQDGAHRLQVYLKKDVLGDDAYRLSQELDLGDWIGVDGRLFRTKTDELTVEAALELIDKPTDDRVLGEDPETGLPVIARAGRFGPYVQVGTAEDTGKKKPKTASLLRSMTLDGIELADALKLLTLPRTVGTDPADGTPITAQNGRYGPYIQKGSDSRTLESEDLLFTVTLEQCLALLAQPKRRGRQAAAAAPLRELGNDPASGQPMVIKEGRWGPYVTDGETNASLRTGDAVQTITLERAAELLQLRRERGPAKRPARGATRRKSTTGSKRTTRQKAAS
jgi:DNA topoisomerase-1